MAGARGVVRERLRAVACGLAAAWLLSLAPPTAAADEPPRFEVPAPQAGRLTFIAYGDTRFTQRDAVANPFARRSLVQRIADEQPAAILIGGDLVYDGADAADYAAFRSETQEWAQRRIAVFPALGNHEFKGCSVESNDSVCLENWWRTFEPLPLRGHRWYSVTLGASILALVLDSDSALKPGSEQRAWLEAQVRAAPPRIRFILIVLHYPPVRDPLFPRARDEGEVARYLSKKARFLTARVIVIGSHVHNYERFSRDGVVYLVSGGGGAKPVPALRMAGELSHLRTSVNFHYLRFTLENERLTGTMVRFDASDPGAQPWTEPDHFEVAASAVPP